jgi:hypothetical protein
MIFEIVVAGVFAAFLTAVAFAMFANDWAVRRIYPVVMGIIGLITCGKMLMVANLPMALLGLVALALVAIFRNVDRRVWRG